jgi:predicted dinucleotide-binding enzyme
MKIGILGTGIVGNTLGTAFIAKGHEVKMGSRDAVNEKAIEWTKANGKNASQGTFEDAAQFGDIIFNYTSLGESIQAALPATKVVKTLNTLNCTLMIDANKLANGDHNLFICGNDEASKEIVKDLLHEDFNWKKENIIDLGDISNSRGTEQLLPIWIRLWAALGTADFNFKIVR